MQPKCAGNSMSLFSKNIAFFKYISINTDYKFLDRQKKLKKSTTKSHTQGKLDTYFYKSTKSTIKKVTYK